MRGMAVTVDAGSEGDPPVPTMEALLTGGILTVRRHSAASVHGRPTAFLLSLAASLNPCRYWNVAASSPTQVRRSAFRVPSAFIDARAASNVSLSALP